jgi:hypothetical protein
LRGEFYKERKRRRGGGFGCGLLILFFSLVSLFIIFTAEVGGLGALRWLLEGYIYKERKRAARGTLNALSGL